MAILHGGRLDAAMLRYGGARETWIDLSTGINPKAYPVKQFPNDIWSRLPDVGAETRLKEVARNYYHVSASAEITIANGTQAIIERLPQVYGLGRVGIVTPTYGEHAYIWRKAGAKVFEIASFEDLPNDLDVLVVVNPNNPDCRIWQPGELCKVATRVGSLIVDEAFCDPMPELSIVEHLPENAMVLKSFGKFFGLAGVRLGFAVCKSELASRLENTIGPWAASGPALEVGYQALLDQFWIADTRTYLDQTSKELAELLKLKEFSVLGVNPLFVYAQHQEAKAVYEYLARHQILVRAFDDQPNLLRFGLCKDAIQLQRLSEVLSEYASA